MKRFPALFLLVAAMIAVATIGGCITSSTPSKGSSTTPASSVVLYNPWVSKAHTYRGALHSHTSNSDGALTTEKLTEAYASEGFAFLFITDHDRVTQAPAASDMLVLPGEEITTCAVCPPRSNADTGEHIIALNITSRIASQQPPQQVINGINAQGGLALLAHPTLSSNDKPVANSTLYNLKGYRLVEVTNLDAAEALVFYDAALSRGTQAWLAGGDDAHTLREVNATASVIINADRLTPVDILATLQAGNFYVTTGHGIARSPGEARISAITTNNRTICVSVPEPNTITWIQKGGIVLKATEGVTNGIYTGRGDERYVRVMISPRAYPAQHAWSQPVRVEARLSSRT
ncbi:MAG: CehA/McbA family metallohydrolase [Halobacteriota archaeon]